MTTLNQWIISQTHLESDQKIQLANLFGGLEMACQIISDAISRAAIDHRLGSTGQKNVQDEVVQKLDSYADQAFIDALKSTGQVCLLVSEENTNAEIIEESSAGQYIVAYDPLDGSSNIDVNVSVGSIFGIWPKKSKGKKADLSDILRSGSDMIAAGYTLYSSSTMFVVSLGCGVAGFTLDRLNNQFILTHPDLKIPPKGQIYSINEGNSAFWDIPTSQYVTSLKHRIKGPPYSLRYIGSMVSDVHRTLLYGGIFMYPADSKSVQGKLRYLYEVAPISFIIEQAGGRSIDSLQNSLDKVAKNLHERVPVFLGSAEDVTDLKTFYLAETTKIVTK